MAVDIHQAAALIAAVREAAGRAILPRFRALSDDEITTKSGPQDLVTIADQEAELLIGASAAEILPGALVIGEEGVAAQPGLLSGLGAAEQAVIIDPVDGTRNFANGLAVFGVILAVTEAGETVFGLLYDPVMDDWVMAHKGQGAWFCRPDAAPTRLTGAPTRPPEVASAYVPTFLYSMQERKDRAEALARYAMVTSLHCSCHEYRQMALGNVDVIIGRNPAPWDHAAGTLIVSEAGGGAYATTGEAYEPAGSQDGLIVIANRSGGLTQAQRALLP